MYNTNINNIPCYLFNAAWNAAEAAFKVTVVIGTVTAATTFGAPLVGVATPASLTFNSLFCYSFFKASTINFFSKQLFSMIVLTLKNSKILTLY